VLSKCVGFFIVIFIAGVSSYADPVLNSFGGVLMPAGETMIELKDLTLVLEQRGVMMGVATDYRFHNPDVERELTVGFITLPHIPSDRGLDTPLAPNIEGLGARAKGEPVAFQADPISYTMFPKELKEITDLSYVYHASIRFRNGENTARVRHDFQPSRDGASPRGQVFYPVTLSPLRLWANHRVDSFSLRIAMVECSLFTVPRALSTPGESEPWRLTGEGNIGRSDGTDSSDNELLYVCLKSGVLVLERENYAPERDLMAKMYRPLDHAEPLKSMYWRVFNGEGLGHYTSKDLQTARNMLYALHGYAFERPDLFKQFSPYFWYYPYHDVTDSPDILTGEGQTLLRHITGLEYESIPDAVAQGKVSAWFDVRVTASGKPRTLKFQIVRAGNTFRLIGMHGGVINYSHGVFRVEGARRITVKMRDVGDPYLRWYTTWIDDGSGGFINLDGGDCGPDEWKASHCSCPTVAGQKQIRYDLFRYTDTPYTGDVVVAVSSYVGYWRFEVKDVTYWIDDGVLYDALCIDMGIPGTFPGRELRAGFEIRYPDPGTKIWAFQALQYNCGDAISLARQNFLVHREKNRPIIGD
jgi:hypothetical protein